MGFRRKTDDLNNKPYDRNASPEQKAKEFSQQFNQNRGKAKGIDPEVKGAPKKNGRHAK